MVRIFEEVSSDGVKSYGIEYIFGHGYSDANIKRLNTLCDTITYREYIKATTGSYPISTGYIDYGIGGRRHNITFYNVPLQYVKQAANKIANILDTICICPYR